MNRIAMILVFVAVTEAHLVEELATVDELADAFGPRVIDGEQAVDNKQFPYQVGFHTYEAHNRRFCGGSLISGKWVLTAAHCVERAINFHVYLGSITRGLGLVPYVGDVKVVTNISYSHPNYTRSTVNNDIALIEFESPVSFSENIKTIRLANSSESAGDGVNLTFTGWGHTRNSSQLSDMLNFVVLRSITNKKCRETYATYRIIDSTLCAVGYPNQSACMGDSGGPLVNIDSEGKPYQVGLFSFYSRSGCGVGKPSAYVRPEKYLNWINNVTGLHF